MKEYKEGDYKEYDHFKVINIDRTEDIPDYDGVMGVPVTFLEKWNPGQFDILGKSGGGCRYNDYINRDYMGCFNRVFIKKNRVCYIYSGQGGSAQRQKFQFLWVGRVQGITNPESFYYPFPV